MSILSLRGHRQNQNPETILICIVVQCFQHDIIARIHSHDERYEIRRAKRLSHALVRFVTERANLFISNKISSLTIRAKYRHFRTICEQTVDNSPAVSFSSSLS